MRWAILALALLASPAAAQVSYPPVTIDTSVIATKGDVQAASDAAAAAQQQAATAAANMCLPSAVVPPSEVIGGAAGSGKACRLANSVQPRISRTVAFSTGSTGTAVLAWTDMGAVPKVYVQPDVSAAATMVPSCYPVAGSITSTGVTIKCYITQSLLGLGLAPFVAAGTGVTGQILALPVAQ